MFLLEEIIRKVSQAIARQTPILFLERSTLPESNLSSPEHSVMHFHVPFSRREYVQLNRARLCTIPSVFHSELEIEVYSYVVELKLK